MTNEVSIRCQKNTRSWYTAYTPHPRKNTPGYPSRCTITPKRDKILQKNRSQSVHSVELSTAVADVDTLVSNASLTQNQCLQCATPPLTHVEIPRPRKLTQRHWNERRHDQVRRRRPLSNRTNLSIFPKRFNQRRFQFMFAYSFSNILTCSCSVMFFLLKSFC